MLWRTSSLEVLLNRGCSKSIGANGRTLSVLPACCSRVFRSPRMACEAQLHALTAGVGRIVCPRATNCHGDRPEPPCVHRAGRA